jgi:uncharacterized membrane protein YhaH (DUF805 family)
MDLKNTSWLIKLIRWSAWPLLVIIVAMFLTGYIISGRYGLSAIMTEQSALAFHKALHIPFLIFLLAHCVPATYLAIKRWKNRMKNEP